MPPQLIAKIILLTCLSLLFHVANAETSFSDNSTYEVCFTPGQDCTGLIVNTIAQAKETIYVQAYSFTSAPIAKALVDAKRRGVNVEVILDKSQTKTNKYSSATFLLNNHIPTWVDYKPSIAHNKIMIFDKTVVMTGSFNFTKSAQRRNAENLIVITDPVLAKKYLKNWLARQAQSRYLK